MANMADPEVVVPAAASYSYPAVSPMGDSVTKTNTFTYTYDPLNRLKSADIDGTIHFEYTYDAVGNRLSDVSPNGVYNYTYDAANRIVMANEITYTWDAKGNMLSDGENEYVYNHANQLTQLTTEEDAQAYNYTYNGYGDRLTQTDSEDTTTYTLDMMAPYTQVLSDGENTYLYGLDRIGEQSDEWVYHLPDALGSVRQIVNPSQEIVYARTYTPYGTVYDSAGTGASQYGFSGELTDPSELIYLRARYYRPALGRFISRDTWSGNAWQPQTLNRWSYVSANPL